MLKNADEKENNIRVTELPNAAGSAAPPDCADAGYKWKPAESLVNLAVVLEISTISATGHESWARATHVLLN